MHLFLVASFPLAGKMVEKITCARKDLHEGFEVFLNSAQVLTCSVVYAHIKV